MSVTSSFAIAAGHHLEPTGSFGNSRARPLRSPPGVRHSFLLASDFHPVPGSSFAIPPAAGPGGCRLFWVSGNAPNPLTLRRKNRYRAGPNRDTHTTKIRVADQRHTAWHRREHPAMPCPILLDLASPRDTTQCLAVLCAILTLQPYAHSPEKRFTAPVPRQSFVVAMCTDYARAACRIRQAILK